jgi:hypothetical protein
MCGSRRSLVIFLAVAVIAVTAGTSTAWAQFTSSMEGTVLDPEGARIPGASITIVNVATGIKNTTATNSVGYFLFPSLPSGTFKVTISAPGFKTKEVSDLGLELEQRRTLNITLEVGAQSTTVTVEAEAVAVDLAEVRLAGRVENKQILELPISGQNFMGLVGLTAGITGNANMGDIFSGEQQVNISANGQRGEQNGFSVDSATVTSMVRHGRTNLQPNAESIQEMQVTVSNFSAESGNDAGANVNVATKSGTNTYHGSLAWYHTNNKFQSRNIFQVTPNALTGRIMPVSRRNEATGSFGGPILKNKLFFFSSFDVLRSQTGDNNVTTVETPEFANYVIQTYPNNLSAYLLKNYPSMTTPERNFRTAGDLITPRAIDCSTLASPSALISTPIGMLPCNMKIMGDGMNPIPSQRPGYQWNTRVDYQVGNNDRLYFNLFRNSDKSTSGNRNRPQFTYIYPIWNWYGNINETHTFSPTVLNELRATVTRVHGEIQCRECQIPSGVNTGSPGFDGFGIGGPVPFIQNNYEYKDNLSIIRGAHSIKAGVVFSFLQSNWKPTASYQRPSFSFQTVWDFVRDDPFSEGNIGLNPVTGSVYTPDVAERQHTQGWFIQDTWKAKTNLTVTYGVRWEYYGMVNQATMGNNVEWRGGTDTWSRLMNGANVTKYHILDHGDKNNYAPRLAIAWDPFGKGQTSIRAGFGIFYDFLPSQLYGGAHYTPPLYMIITASKQTAPLLPNYGLGLSGEDPYQFPRPKGLENVVGLDSKNGSTYARANITWIDPSLRSSYTPSWSFGIQQALTPTMFLDVTYVGNRGRKLYAKYDMNRFAGDLLADNYLNRINSSFGSISYGQSNFTSDYNGINVTLRKRTSRGVMFNVSYTAGHAISMSDSFGANPIDAWNTKLDRGPTGVPQKLAGSVIYEIPTWTEAPMVAKQIMSGWQLSGVFTATSGGYFSVTCGSRAFTPVRDSTGKIIGNTGCDYNADGNNNDRPNAPAFGSKLDLSRENLLINGVFKASDFPTPGLGQTGNLGRNTFRGLADNNIDLAVSRNFKLPWLGGETSNLQFRAEAFNAPNRVHLGGISTTMTSTNFGKVTSASNARRFAFSLRLSF